MEPHIANCDLTAIESAASYGRIFVGLDNSRQVEFNAQEHCRLVHG